MEKFRLKLIGGLALGFSVITPAQAFEPFIGQVMWTASSFCPRGWADADGQLLQISQNTALFSLMGTTYGGDGRTTFALPDLRGRVSLHQGTGPGLSTYQQGNKGGSEAVTLTTSQLPSHSHTINASSTASDGNATGSILGSGKKKIYDAPTAADITLDSSAVSNTGSGQAHENRPPYVTLRACIALEGLFPSRN